MPHHHDKVVDHGGDTVSHEKISKLAKLLDKETCSGWLALKCALVEVWERHLTCSKVLSSSLMFTFWTQSTSLLRWVHFQQQL